MADGFDDAEVAVLLAVFDSFGRAQKHVARRITRLGRRAARGQVFTTSVWGVFEGENHEFAGEFAPPSPENSQKPLPV
jgi:hypothetical protein